MKNIIEPLHKFSDTLLTLWHEASIQKAKSLGIDIDGSTATESLSRAKAAEMIARSLRNI